MGTRQGQGGPKEGGLRKALAGHRSATHTPVTPAQRVASTKVHVDRLRRSVLSWELIC